MATKFVANVANRTTEIELTGINIAATIGDSGSNIEQVEVLGRHEDCSVLSFLILVKDRNILNMCTPLARVHTDSVHIFLRGLKIFIEI